MVYQSDEVQEHVRLHKLSNQSIRNAEHVGRLKKVYASVLNDVTKIEENPGKNQVHVRVVA